MDNQHPDFNKPTANLQERWKKSSKLSLLLAKQEDEETRKLNEELLLTPETRRAGRLFLPLLYSIIIFLVIEFICLAILILFSK